VQACRLSCSSTNSVEQRNAKIMTRTSPILCSSLIILFASFVFAEGVSPKQRRHTGYPRNRKKAFLLSLFWLHPPPPSADIAGYKCSKERRITKREVMKVMKGGGGFGSKKTAQKRGPRQFHSSYDYTYMIVQPNDIFSVLF
jgi:hypothetical protein